MALFLTSHPTVQVQVDERAADQIAARLEAGTLDLGIADRPSHPAGLRFEPLFHEEMVLVVSERHPFARRRRIRMVELHQQALVLLPSSFSTRTLLDECFASCGAEPVVVAEMSSIAPMLGLVLLMPIGAIADASSRHAPFGSQSVGVGQARREPVRLAPA